MLKRYPNFYSSSKSIKEGVIPGTSGYHIHFQFKESEAEKAILLCEVVKKFINAYKKGLSKNHPAVYITDEYLAPKPGGPWRERMWELEISPIANKDEANRDAFDREKNEAVYYCMLEVVKFIRHLLREDRELGLLGLDGVLLVHANIYPDNSDMRLEQRLHRLEHAWLAYGNPETFALKDIWVELIEIENHIKKHIEEAGAKWEDSDEQRDRLVGELKEKFGSVARHESEACVERRARSLLKGQGLLRKLGAQQAEFVPGRVEMR